MTHPERFQDTGAHLTEFLDELLVECPRCKGRAVVRQIGEEMVLEGDLKPGEQLVTEGQLRLENGVKVEILKEGGAQPEAKALPDAAVRISE